MTNNAAISVCDNIKNVKKYDLFKKKNFYNLNTHTHISSKKLFSFHLIFFNFQIHDFLFNLKKIYFLTFFSLVTFQHSKEHLILFLYFLIIFSHSGTINYFIYKLNNFYKIIFFHRF